MSYNQQIRKSAAGDGFSLRRRRACVLLLGVLGLVATACGGSADGVATVADVASEPTGVVAAANESTSDEAADQADEATEPATEEEVDEEAAGHDADEAGDDTGDDDHGAENDADDHGDTTGDDDHGDDTDGDHGDTGELIITAVDGTPEIGTGLEPGAVVPQGTYVLNVLGEDWRLSVAEPLLFGASDREFFAVTTEGLVGSNTLVAFMKTDGIVLPRDVGVHVEHDQKISDVTVDIPDDLTSWFDAVPQVVLVDSGSTTVAGEPATWFRLTVDPAAGATFKCPVGDQCIGFVAAQGSVTVLSQEIDVTVWQLDALPGVMPWVQVQDPTKADMAQQVMVDLLDGLTAA